MDVAEAGPNGPLAVLAGRSARGGRSRWLAVLAAYSDVAPSALATGRCCQGRSLPVLHRTRPSEQGRRRCWDSNLGLRTVVSLVVATG